MHQQAAHRASLGIDAVWHGFNALQSAQAPWGSVEAKRSLQQLAATGANSVALIPFLVQDHLHDTHIHIGNHVTEAQLSAAIRDAHAAGLSVVLKPQVLIRDHWAGELAFHDHAQESTWFAHYSRAMLHYAQLARQMGVEALVIGTELQGMAQSRHWPQLIQQLRATYRGLLTYTAHNVEGVEAFPYWDQLDLIALSFYPNMGASGNPEEMLASVRRNLQRLNQAVQGMHQPLWLLEIGIPSAQGASSRPWDWHDLSQRAPDLQLQQDAIAAWLQALQDTPRIRGVFIWNWMSDPHAGGTSDVDYTLQHKPAERVVRQQWQR